MKRMYKMGLWLLCCLFCLTGLPVSVAAQTHADYACKVYESPNQTVIGRFENGIRLTVLGEKGGFYLVDCYEMNGYVAKSQVRQENGKYYVNCQENSDHSAPMEYVSLDRALQLRASFLSTAQGKLGCPYVYATAGPNTFDCSGLTSYIYKQFGYGLMRSARDELMDGIIVSPEGLQVGDLIFYNRTSRHGGNQVSHVAMYAGNGKIIHADSRGVRYTDMTDSYYAARYVCARRVINVRPAQKWQLTTTSAATSVMRGYESEGLR